MHIAGVQPGLEQIKLLGTEVFSCRKEGADSLLPSTQQLVYKADAACWANKFLKIAKPAILGLLSTGIGWAGEVQSPDKTQEGSFSLGHIHGICICGVLAVKAELQEAIEGSP